MREQIGCLFINLEEIKFPLPNVLIRLRREARAGEEPIFYDERASKLSMGMRSKTGMIRVWFNKFELFDNESQWLNFFVPTNIKI